MMMTPPLLRYFWFHSIYSLAASCSLQSATVIHRLDSRESFLHVWFLEPFVWCIQPSDKPWSPCLILTILKQPIFAFLPHSVCFKHFFYLQSKMLVLISSKFIAIIVITTKATLACEQALPGVQGLRWGREEGKEGVMDERTTDMPSYNIY